eukprot:snap_masked-scaffold_2-processed-gene-5.7-mRNA-1 protein AED:1.00 eAED:1.00 QI:0/-1/0/0/-1/1/1/0/99
MAEQNSCSPINLTGDTVGKSWHKGLTNTLPQKRKNKTDYRLNEKVSFVSRDFRNEVYKYFDDYNYVDKLKCKLCSKPVNYIRKNSSRMISPMRKRVLIR